MVGLRGMPSLLPESTSPELYGTCVPALWDMCPSSMGHVSELYGTCVRALWDMCPSSMGHVSELFGTCVRALWVRI